MAVIGSVVPGSSIVFVGGVLVGVGALDVWSTAAAALVGAIIGDGASFWLGHRYREQIRGMWPVKNHLALFERGDVYFQKKGTKSIFLGRFLGPLRAIVPVIAGMSDMPALKFYLVNVASAFAWAALHLIPGVVFGASLQLAGAVSSRLALLLILTAVVLWAVSKLVQWALRRRWPYLRTLRDRVIQRARRKSGFVSGIVLSLFDPARPESKGLLTAAVLLLASTWLFLGVLQDVLAGDPLVQLDQTIFIAFQNARTEWVDRVMITVTEAAGPAGTIAAVVGVAALLAIRRHWRTFGYWLAAAGFAEVLVWVIKFTVARKRPHNFFAGVEQYSLPSGHSTLSVVVYGFMAFLLARGKAMWQRIIIVLIAAAVILLISGSRVYLGVHWFSDVVASFSLGLAWVAVLSMVYTNHVRNEPLRAVPLALVMLASIVLVGGLYARQHHSADVARFAYAPTRATTFLAAWKDGGWRSLPAARSEFGGDVEEPFLVQWVGTPSEITDALVATGWRSAQSWSAKSVLLWLSPSAKIEQLPVFPRFNRGQVQRLTFVKNVDAEQRLVVRLWNARTEVIWPTGRPAQGLWYGTATMERVSHAKGLATFVETLPNDSKALNALSQDVSTQHLSMEKRDREGMAVVLVWWGTNPQ